jgi:hypothetical protein
MKLYETFTGSSVHLENLFIAVDSGDRNDEQSETNEDE